jgi:hypothetical protein
MQRNERLCLLFLALPQCQSPELQARFAFPSSEASLAFSSEKKTARPTKLSAKGGNLRLSGSPAWIINGNCCASALALLISPRDAKASKEALGYMADRKDSGSRADIPQPAPRMCHRRWPQVFLRMGHLAGRPGLKSGVTRRQSRHTVIGVTCALNSVGLDSHHATSRRHSCRVSGDLLDCHAPAGVHDPRKSDDSPRA